MMINTSIHNDNHTDNDTDNNNNNNSTTNNNNKHNSKNNNHSHNNNNNINDNNNNDIKRLLGQVPALDAQLQGRGTRLHHLLEHIINLFNLILIS